jgi:abequosyltransferase
MAIPRLSICIPTYNRRNYLADTITSITNQVSAVDASRIEICVSDNGSTDGTEILIRELQSSTPVRIIFSRNETNLGADANYLRAVELASGDYCWYMGSDDTAASRSLARFLREIDEGHDIYLCNRIDCDIDMTYIRDRFWLDKSIQSEVFDFTAQDQFRRYAKHSLSVGALFGYLSSIVFKREKWQAVTIDPVFMGTAYSHVYMLLSFIKTGCTLKYISDHLVNSRGGNDSFWAPSNDGIVKRIMIDIDGYLLLADKLFSSAPAHFNGVLQVLHAERPAVKTLAILRLRTDDQSWDHVAKRLKRAGYSAWLIYLVGMMRPLISTVKRLRDLGVSRSA